MSRADAVWSSSSTWELKVLGAFELLRDGESIALFRTRREEELLAFLAVHAPESVSRIAAAASLWPAEDASVGRKYLSYHLFALRKRLRSLGIDMGVVDVGTNLALSADLSVDATHFGQHIVEATTACTVAERILSLEQASMLYEGELLPGFDVGWVVQPRKRLSVAYRRTMNLLAEAMHKDADLRALMSDTPPGTWRRSRLQVVGCDSDVVTSDQAGPFASVSTASASEADIDRLVEFVAEAARGMTSGDRSTWLDRLARRQAEVESGFTVAMDLERYDAAYAIAVPIWRYWYSAGRSGRGLALLERLLAAPYVPEARSRALALHASGTLAHYSERDDIALRRLGEAVALWETLPPDEGACFTLGNLAIVYYHLGDLDEAQRLYDRANELAESNGFNAALIKGLHDAAICARARGANAMARAMSVKRLALLEAQGAPPVELLPSLVEIASVDLGERKLDAAVESASRAIEVARAVGDNKRLSVSLTELGFVAYLRGDASAAVQMMRDGLAAALRSGSRWHEGMALGYLACALELGGREDDAAATMLRATTVLRSTPDRRAVEVLQTGVRQLTEGGVWVAAG